MSIMQLNCLNNHDEHLVQYSKAAYFVFQINHHTKDDIPPIPRFLKSSTQDPSSCRIYVEAWNDVTPELTTFQYTSWKIKTDVFTDSNTSR